MTQLTLIQKKSPTPIERIGKTKKNSRCEVAGGVCTLSVFFFVLERGLGLEKGNKDFRFITAHAPFFTNRP